MSQEAGAAASAEAAPRSLNDFSASRASQASGERLGTEAKAKERYRQSPQPVSHLPLLLHQQRLPRALAVYPTFTDHLYKQFYFRLTTTALRCSLTAGADAVSSSDAHLRQLVLRLPTSDSCGNRRQEGVDHGLQTQGGFAKLDELIISVSQVSKEISNSLLLKQDLSEADV